MIWDLISALTGGIGLLLVINAIPIAIFWTYSRERKKDPEGYKKVEDSFIQFIKDL